MLAIGLFLGCDPRPQDLLGLFLHGLAQVALLARQLISLLRDQAELLEVSDELIAQLLFSLVASLVPLGEAVRQIDLLLLPLLQNRKVMPHKVQVEENLALCDLLEVF